MRSGTAPRAAWVMTSAVLVPIAGQLGERAVGDALLELALGQARG